MTSTQKQKDKCPVCSQPTAQHGTLAFKPFCCQRCADLDLGRWLRGAYTVSVPGDLAEDAPLPGENANETDEN